MVPSGDIWKLAGAVIVRGVPVSIEPEREKSRGVEVVLVVTAPNAREVGLAATVGARGVIVT